MLKSPIVLKPTCSSHDNFIVIRWIVSYPPVTFIEYLQEYLKAQYIVQLESHHMFLLFSGYGCIGSRLRGNAFFTSFSFKRVFPSYTMVQNKDSKDQMTRIIERVYGHTMIPQTLYIQVLLPWQNFV